MKPEEVLRIVDAIHLDKNIDKEIVFEGIEAARSAGFKRIKLNSVVQKGRNDDEILDLVEFAIERGLDISFIEEMPLGSVSSHQRQITFCSSDEVRERIEARHTLVRSSHATGGPSRYWQVAGSETQVGFISPHKGLEDLLFCFSGLEIFGFQAFQWAGVFPELLFIFLLPGF